MVCRPLSRTCSPAAEKITETLQAFLFLPRVGAVSPSASGLPFLATRLGLSPQTHWWGLLAFLLLRIRQLAELLDAPVCPLSELAHLLELFPQILFCQVLRVQYLLDVLIDHFPEELEVVQLRRRLWRHLVARCL